MTYQERYNLWLTDGFFDQSIKDELRLLDAVKDAKEIEDRFYRELEFGTGGLRAVMGAGTNRMNRYTVARATAGLADYLINSFGIEKCINNGISIAYDTRNNSEYFAKTVADVLSAKNIKVYLFNSARPTPQLSYAVKKLNCIAGIVITASHNPKEYNGYKVYDENGCQIVPHQAEQVTLYINKITDYQKIDFNAKSELIEECDLTDDFVIDVFKQSLSKDKESKEKLKVVYTPIHGTGYMPIVKILNMSGFTQVSIVEEQVVLNGDFPTVVSPNPEDSKALKLGIVQAEKENADLVIGTDPDCDRIGVAVKTQDDYVLITGNQMGALLVDYVLSHKDISNFKNPALVKTIVTSELGANIAKKHGLKVFSTLTGFKYIGEKITEFEKAKLNRNAVQDYDFVIGYEESYGYLVGTHARDKDAVVSALLICEMAAKYKSQGKTLIDRISELYKEHGYYLDALDSFTLKGKDGIHKISCMMRELRESDLVFENTMDVIDYISPVESEKGFPKLPVADVLKYILNDGSWIAVRPSGTEPKIKIYYNIRENDIDKANAKLNEIRTIIKAKLNLE